MIWGCLGGHLIVLELLKMVDFGQIQRFFVLIDPPRRFLPPKHGLRCLIPG